MTALLGGVGAACCWAIAMLSSSRASRQVGAGPTLAGVSLVGFVLVLPFILLSGSPPTASSGWLLLAGTGNVLGLLFEYIAIRSGLVGIVAAIASTEGAIAAVIATLAGEPMTVNTRAALAVIAVGVVLASLGPSEGDEDTAAARRAVVLALGASVAFGVGLYAAGRVSGDVPLAWVVLPARLVGVVAIAIPVTLRGRLQVTRHAAPMILTAGVAEVVGIASFALGARDSIGVTSVLGSQFAAFATVGAFVLFGERLRRIQVVGVVTILFGVAVLAAIRASA